uniref:Uncharacterized protein n=1 Tax=Solibacter usitatus (strain Ellin6076) TaxID=234267 RepID=Q02BK0_SOLUE
MISVILYGRNDSYGYNLHKRGAISLNCLAALLSDPDDEILFVDCNTSNELPTFVEAIYDTLTPRAKALLRVFRVRPELHKRLVGGYTHLMVVEPPPRNIALRRSNPRNHWVLNTNTDILLVPRPGFRDLTDVARDLSDGLYTLPRFELPEALWETFPRSDPQATLQACRDLGPRLHLDEVTLSFPESRFDQVGDFMLSPRQALWDIHGFDERMIHGWHCDSNVCKRLYIYYGGRTESLADRLKGYHCDHTRVQTGMHQFDMKLDNNVQEFVFSLEDPYARHQAETWGLPNEPIEELDLANDPQARFVTAVERTLGAPQESYYQSDAVGIRNFVSVQAEHVLPYLANDLTVFTRSARFAYVGNHPRMLSLAARCVVELGFETPLDYAASLLTSGAPPENARAIDADPLPETLLASYDLLVFDLSLDVEGLNGMPAERVTDWPRPLRYSLGAVARCLEMCAELAGAGGTRVPDVVVINANHHTFRNFVNQFLLLTFTPFATHVRKGRPRVGEERRYRSNTWKQTEDDMRSFFGFGVDDASVPPVAIDESIDFTSAGPAASHKDGHWGATDHTGTWTDGDRAVLLFRPPSPVEGDVVACVTVNEALIGPEGDPIRVEVSLDGVPLANWSFFSRYEVVDAKVTIPAASLAGKEVCCLEFHVRNPQSAARLAKARGEQVFGDDPRALGFKVHRIVFRSYQRLRYRPGQILDFTAAGTGAVHTDECWSAPDGLGMWSFGPRSSLTLLPDKPMDQRAQVVFTVNDAALNNEHPTQTVRVLWNGLPAAEWNLGPARDAGELRILLPPDALLPSKPVNIAFEIAAPRRPLDLGLSTWDTRPLGFRLCRLRISPVGRLTYRPGDPIDFFEGGDSMAFVGDAMGSQWSFPGPRGSWTIGTRCSFHVTFDGPVAGDLPCAFVISDCMIPARAKPLPVTVKANGQAIAEWLLGDRNPHRQFATIPAAVLAQGAAAAPELTLVFEIPEPRSPESLGWNADPRPLGFLLARVVIGSREVAIPKFKADGGERPMYQRILGLPRYAAHLVRTLAKRYSS